MTLNIIVQDEAAVTVSEDTLNRLTKVLAEYPEASVDVMTLMTHAYRDGVLTALNRVQQMLDEDESEEEEEAPRQQ